MNDSGLLTRIFVGFFLILLGIGFLLDQLGLNFLNFNVFNFWPLIFFAIGIPMLVKRNLIGAMIFIMLGIVFLFANFFGYSIFAIIWPAIIILIGISIIFKPRNGPWENNKSATVSKDSINESVVFWGLDNVINSDNFLGGKVDCVFGGFKLDLRNVKIAKEGANLELNAVFGGGEITLPKDARIQVDGTGVFGGVNNNTQSGKEEDPIIKIKASAVFGGIEIRN